MKKFNMKSLILVLIVLLAGCGNTSEGKIELNTSAQSQFEKPPALAISIGKKTVNAQPGGYSWSYLITKEYFNLKF